MTQHSFPWNDVNGDRLYDAEDFMRFFAAFLKTGVVMSFKDGLRVLSAQNGMNIQVGAGSAVIDGGSYLNDEAIAIQVNVASSVQNRTDSVVLRMDKNARDTYLYYKASDTTVVRNDTIYELQLATISVKMNATQITDADITDTRSDSTVCGWSTPFDNINVDGIVDQYKGIFAQADKEFQAWFDNLQSQLDDNQAANLQNQINKSIHDAGEIIPETDLDYLNSPGFYFGINMIPGTTILNTPPQITAEFSGQVIVYKNDNSTMIRQVVLDNITGKEYQRYYSSDPGAWSSWNEVVMSVDGLVSIGSLKVSGTVEYPVITGTLNSTNLPGISMSKSGNAVAIHMVGSNSNAIANGGNIGRLPTGFIPSLDWHFSVRATNGNDYRVIVNASGLMTAGEAIPASTSFRDTMNYMI